jgi:tetrahydromethanopterin S-methyltransferase subunit D
MLIFIVTFSLFFIEALLHYNYGSEKTDIHFPNFKDLCQIIITVALFSFFNSKIINYLTRYYKLQ